MKDMEVICHMLISIDGKVTGSYLKNEYILGCLNHYYRIHRKLNGDAFACGRVTMEGSFTNGYYPDLSKYSGSDIDYSDYIAPHAVNKYAVAFDRKGRLGWKEGILFDEDEGYSNRHIIEVLTKEANSAYLSYLRTIGVSYIVAGDNELDMKLAIEKLSTLFNIKTLILEGGSILDGAFLLNNLVDELSLVLTPILGNSEDKPLFYESIETCFELINVEKLDKNTIYLRYKKKD